MIILIDYYSFTIQIPEPLGKAMFDADQLTAIETFLSFCDTEAIRKILTDNWSPEKAKGFYTTRLRHSPSDVALSYGTINSHIFVEFAGQACANLDALDLLLPLIERSNSRATRIDFAIDIKTDITPKEFIAARSTAAFKSSGNKYSPTGGTEYLGGRSSERMARVYRYYAPHPRHEFLRVEAEYKGDAAKASAKSIAEQGVAQTGINAHQPFGWSHAIWNTDGLESRRISYKAYSPSTASTLHWLYGDVVTAMRKAIKTGLIDLDEWLKIVREGLN